MRRLLYVLFAFLLVSMGAAQENPLKKSSRGDWAKYLVSSKNETVPLLSTKELPKWRVISNVGDGFVRIDNYTMFGKNRVGAGGTLAYFKDSFEPVQGLAKGAKIEVVSSSKDDLTINGKKFSCTKIVRKINQPLDDSKVQPSWIGTSTIWVCPDVPLGLAKMENSYQTQLSKSDKGSKMVDTWVVAESGFKNWK